MHRINGELIFFSFMQQNADIIFVVHEEKVVEQGCHTDLIQNENGTYSRLIKRQMEAQQKLDETKA